MPEDRPPTDRASHRCHVCAADRVRLVPGFAHVRRVTSDSKPWSSGGRLGVCDDCGTVQKIIDAPWEAEVAQIYGSYEVYHQGEGAEQQVFALESGLAAGRSERILEYLRDHVALPGSARVLDIGCGNGAMLRACARQCPGWVLAGTELSGKYRAQVESIAGVERLYACPPDRVPGSFQVITMIHVLEHLQQPVAFLSGLAARLAPGGFLVLEVPDFTRNPFDLTVADHCSHFSRATLVDLLRRAGYEVVAAEEGWIPKELTVVARHGGADPSPPADPVGRVYDLVADQVAWLRRVAASARGLACARRCGIFGTSIAATWLFAEVDGAVSFFVDEDPNRIGALYMGKPVFHPRDAPSRSPVLLALPPRIASSLVPRLARDYPGLDLLLLPRDDAAPAPAAPAAHGTGPEDAAAVDLTVLVTCYNERELITDTLDTVLAALGEMDYTYEIIVIDDRSSDDSVARIRDYIRAHPDQAISLHVNEENQGLATNFVEGAFMGRGTYYRLCCGDNSEPQETLVRIFGCLGKADMIIPFQKQSEVRGKSPLRKSISRTFTRLVNLISGYHLGYYNGSALYLRRNVMRWPPSSYGFGFQVDLTTRLLDQGMSYLQVPCIGIDRKSNSSTALTMRNLLSVAHTLLEVAVRRLRRRLYGRNKRRPREIPAP